ncbi:MAG: universal stress protein [Mycobacterium sp.]|nr:universal stress protein [Mycobacterium sp.]
MTEIDPGASVVVGIDGSRAAMSAARWAIEEAIARDLPLRLVHVAGVETGPDPTVGALPLETEYAETVLRQACAAIEASGRPVKFDTAIIHGHTGEALLAESSHAELLCVGSVGIDAVARTWLGSTATTVAERARCPVAIIRHRRDGQQRRPGAIAVAVTEPGDDEDVVITAMDEARLRNAPLVAIGLWDKDFRYPSADEFDRLVQSWRQRYPDVRVHPVTTRSGLVRFLSGTDAPIDLVVIGPGESARVAHIVGPHNHPIFGHSQCSVLVVHR